MEIYLIGGAVRDQLLGLDIKDRDWVVVGATPEAMQAQGYVAVGKDFPVFLHPDTKEEYALARTERKTARGYKGFEFYTDETITLEDDVLRRDLTINALAQDENGKIIDYVGGQQDIKNRLLRHVSPAFREDPLRVLRVARFAARYHHLGFTLADETKTLMSAIVEAGEMQALVAERVWQETQRALSEKHPEIYFETLRECGALKVLFSEVDRLFGVPQPEKHHPEIDTGVHTMLVLQQACLQTDDVATRFAALTHDLGKGTTDKDILPHHYGHEERGVGLVKALCERLHVPNDYRNLAVITSRYHTHVHKAFEIKPKTVLKVLNKTDAFRKPQRFRQFIEACIADSHGRPGYEDYDYQQAPFFLEALEKTAAVDVQAIIADGFEKEAIREELDRRRLNTLKT